MAMQTMEDLFLHELKDIYSAEKQLLKMLPKLAKNAQSEKLREAFETHAQETQGQLERLDQIFEELGKNTRGAKCLAMEGLLEEAKSLLEEDFEETLLDAALIGAAQKVEHYEIAGYGTLRTFAHLLGMTEAERLLQETLDEEKRTDEKLTQLAETEVNVEASQEA